MVSINKIPDLRFFAKAKVIVAGDILLDRYFKGKVSRISPEVPVPVVHVDNKENRLGGAANVALNLSGWGIKPQLFGVIGKDREGTTIRQLIKQSNIKDNLTVTTKSITTTKLRVVSSQQLLRLDFEDDLSAEAERMNKSLLKKLKFADLLILSDYNKGSLADIEPIIAAAKKQGAFIIIDPKRKDFLPYKGADVLTPNYAEFVAVAGYCGDEQEFLYKARNMVKQLKLKALLITRGSDGMSLVLQDRTYNIPAQVREIYDVTGAGDTVVAVLGAAISAGVKIYEAAELASIAAGISITKAGTGVIGYDDVVRPLVNEAPYLSADELVKQINIERSKGHKIVFTNGVFDIIHPGHVRYLREAAQLGDRLVVAINDDKSVRQIKGKNRPINNLHTRAEMLKGLRQVDWVVPFSEKSPEVLLHKIKPDLLVKGGDYKKKTNILGYDIVESYGGKVKILSHTSDMSTTSIIAKIKKSK